MPASVIVCGLGKVGRAVVEYLVRLGVPVTVVTLREPNLSEDEFLAKARLELGDCRRPEVLTRAGVATARAVLIVTSEAAVNVATAFVARKLSPTVRVVVRVFEPDLIRKLSAALPNAVGLSTSALTAPVFAASAVSGQTLANFVINDVPRRASEVVVRADSPLLGQSVEQIRRQFGCAVVAVRATGDAEPTMLTKIAPDRRLSLGDRLVVCGTQSQTALPESDVRDAGMLVRYGGRVWGWLRPLSETVGELRRSVLPAVVVFALVVAGSSAVLALGRGSSPLDSFYTAVGILAGNTPSDELSEMPAWEKVFVPVMQVVGVGLLGWFVALVADFLFGSRLRQALVFGRIPAHGHIVVAGLGNLGFRVVELLAKSGQTPVVIEPNANARFLAAAGSLDVPVVLGDATDGQTLARAGARGAKCVMALTDNDLTNLEICLRALEQNPTVRRVARMSDPVVARTLYDAVGIHPSFSTADLTAAAFVSAGFEERVRSVFSVDDKIILVADVAVGRDEPHLSAQPISALAAEFDFVPLSLRTAEQLGTAADERVESAEALAATTLSVGDRLTVLIRRSELRRLQQQQRPVKS